MMKNMTSKLKTLVIGITFVAFAAAPLVVVAAPSTSAVFTNAPDCEGRLLGIPPWFRGLAIKDTAGNCGVAAPTDVNGGLQGFIWKIALNIVEMGMVAAAYVAFFIILYSGFLFLTNGSNPSVVEKARVGIINAVIGLAIALAAIAIVNVIFRITG
jgi:hypothetical protein